MISLDSTLMSLQAAIGGAAASDQPYATVWFYDVPAKAKEGNEEYPLVMQRTAFTGATNVNICAAPPVQGTKRHIKTMSIVNRSTNASEDFTVSTYDGTTRVPILNKYNALTLKTIWYEDGEGWSTY